PSVRNWVRMRSESTSAFGQPSETMATRGSRFVSIWNSGKLGKTHSLQFSSFRNLELVQDTPSRPSRISLSDTLLAAAQNVQAVLAGRSLSDSLAATDAALRASAQAVSFHAMRRLGLATALREILVPRKPASPLLDALLRTALALLDTAAELADPAVVVRPGRKVPVYAPHTVVDQAVRAAGQHKKLRPFKGLVNGVLRRYLRERLTILAQALRDPVAQYNHPQW